MKRAIVLGIIMTFLVACAQQPTINTQEEIARLMSLSTKEALTTADLAAITDALADDHAASHELEEVEAMIKYQEFGHATHALASVDNYLQTKKQMNCPGHELGHYYVFARHRETELASHALDEAKEGLHAWQEGAHSEEKAYPGVISYAESNDALKRHIAAIDSGNSTATDEEIEKLIGLRCVEAGSTHTH